MKKLMVMIAIVAMALLVSHSVYAIGTTSGTTITNKAFVVGANFANLTNSKLTNVNTIVGAGWEGTADITGALAGASYSNVTYLTNLGNAGYGFLPTVTVSTATGGAGTLGGFWPWSVYTNDVLYFSGTGTATAGGNALYIGTGASKKLVIRVAVAAAMSSSGYEQYALTATVPTSHVNTVGYTGDNGTLYGGSTVSGWGRIAANSITLYGTGVADGSSEQIWRITGGGAPLISIQKTVFSIAITDALGVDNIAVPGATITYNIKVSNAPTGGVANNVIVRDIVATNLLTGAAGVYSSGSENSWGIRVIGNLVTFSNTSAGGAIEPGNVAHLRVSAIIK